MKAIAAFALTLAVTGIASAQPTSRARITAPAPHATALPPRAETESFIRRSAEQWAAGDAVAMRRFLAEDYVGVASTGEVRNKARQLELAAEPSPYPITRVDYINFTHHGPLVIAQGAETLTPANGGPDRKLIWTDTWLFRDGRWQVVASQDSIRPAEGHDEERAAIVALRADHNKAIAAGDTEGFMRLAADDYVAIFGGGRIIRSKDELRRIWTTAPQRCTRTPRRVDIGTGDGPALRAAEFGEWRCDGDVAGETYNGTYFAHWSKKNGDWRVVSDTYVSLQRRDPAAR
jgi:ketosteroid isomerase-like protein